MKRFFDKGLYFEGLRQGLLTGIIMTSLMLLGAVFGPLTAILSRAAENVQTGSMVKTQIAASSFSPYLIIAYVLLAPILTLVLFSFLNKRNTSDFYHSLPHRRETVFFSYYSAVMTWVIGAMLLSGVVTAGIYLMGSQYFTLNMTSILVMYFNFISAAILVSAVTALAMSITGTGFSNIIVTLLILFLPRLILTIFSQLVISSAKIVPTDAFGIFGDVSFNVPANTVIGLFVNNAQGITAIFDQWQGGLYTMVLGLLYLTGALLLFKNRKSEMAASSAPNRLMQAIYRIAITFVVCLIPSSLLVTMRSQSYRTLGVTVVVLYGLALIVYFAYELITTKKFKNLLKSLPALGILVVLNIAFVWGISISTNAILNNMPEANEISAIVLRADVNYGSIKSYESIIAERTKLKDSALNELIASSLSDTIDRVHNKTYNNGVTYTPQGTENYVTKSIIIYKNNGQKLIRNISIPSGKVAKLQETLLKESTYRDAYIQLPSGNVDLHLSSNLLSKAQLKEVYALLREEVSKMDFQTWYDINDISRQKDALSNYSITSSSMYPSMEGNIFVTGNVGVENFKSQYPITEKTPKAYAKLLQYINESQQAKGIENINKISGANESYQLYISDLNFKDSKGQTRNSNSQLYSYIKINVKQDYTYPNQNQIPPAKLDTLKKLLAQQAGKPVDISKPYYRISVIIGDTQYIDGYASRPSNYTFYVNETGDTSLVTVFSQSKT